MTEDSTEELLGRGYRRGRESVDHTMTGSAFGLWDDERYRKDLNYTEIFEEDIPFYRQTLTNAEREFGEDIRNSNRSLAEEMLASDATIPSEVIQKETSYTTHSGLWKGFLEKGKE